MGLANQQVPDSPEDIIWDGEQDTSESENELEEMWRGEVWAQMQDEAEEEERQPAEVEEEEGPNEEEREEYGEEAEGIEEDDVLQRLWEVEEETEADEETEESESEEEPLLRRSKRHKSLSQVAQESDIPFGFML